MILRNLQKGKNGFFMVLDQVTHILFTPKPDNNVFWLLGVKNF